MIRAVNASQIAARATSSVAAGAAATALRSVQPGVLYAGFSTIAESVSRSSGNSGGSSGGHSAGSSEQQSHQIGSATKNEEVRPGDRSQVHFRATAKKHPLGLGTPKPKGKEWSMPHEIWTTDEVNSIQVTHKEPEEAVDHVALGGVRALRFSFDLLAGFKTGVVDENKCLPQSREEPPPLPPAPAPSQARPPPPRRENKEKDHGWINTLLEEAENERMHLLTFLKLKNPGPIFRFNVMISQGIMFNAFFLAYLVSPKTCHRFVGYIEEEAVHTYTILLKDLDDNKLPLFSNLPAPAIAKSYWKLPDNAMFRDLVLAVRADEANHRVVNHTFADMHKDFKEDAVNPFSIQSKVSSYAEPQGMTTPSVADIAGGPGLSDEERTEAVKEAVEDSKK